MTELAAPDIATQYKTDVRLAAYADTDEANAAGLSNDSVASFEGVQ